MKYLFALFLFPIPIEARPPITAKNAAEIADHINKYKHKDVYSDIAGTAQAGGFYTVEDGPCSNVAFLKDQGYALLDHPTMGGRGSCSVSW